MSHTTILGKMMMTNIQLLCLYFAQDNGDNKHGTRCAGEVRAGGEGSATGVKKGNPPPPKKN